MGYAMIGYDIWVLLQNKRFMEYVQPGKWKYVCPCCGKEESQPGYYYMYRQLSHHMQTHTKDDLDAVLLRLAMEGELV